MPCATNCCPAPNTSNLPCSPAIDRLPGSPSAARTTTANLEELARTRMMAPGKWAKISVFNGCRDRGIIDIHIDAA